MAATLAVGLREIGGVRLVQDVQANEVFAAMPEDMIEALQAEGAYFYRWIDIPGEARPVIRLVTSFATTEEEVAQFVRLLRRNAG
jgi:threonine aldolase